MDTMLGIMIQTAVLVTAILAVRKLLGEKLHAYIRYGLWLFVALRLIIPVNFIDSPFSLFRVLDTVTGGYRVNRVTLSDVGVLGGSLDDNETTSVASQDLALDGEIDASTQEYGYVSGEDHWPQTSVDSVQLDVSTQAELILDEAASNAETGTDQMTGRAGRGDSMFAGYTSQVVLRVFWAIWIVGSLAVGGTFLAAHFRFYRRLYRTRQLCKEGPKGNVGKSRKTEGFREKTERFSGKTEGLSRKIERLSRKTEGLNGKVAGFHKIPEIYRVEKLEAPCLFGVLHPAVYIGTDIQTGTDKFRYVVTHEQVHYLHGDHVWALLRATLVTVYWFHPFVWIAAAVSARDCELACDYGTIRLLGEEERLSYGEMLLELSKADRGKRVYSFGTMLRPGRSEMKERIMCLAGSNSARKWAVVLTAVLMFGLVGCAFTGATEKSVDSGKTGATGDDALQEKDDVLQEQDEAEGSMMTEGSAGPDAGKDVSDSEDISDSKGTSGIRDISDSKGTSGTRDVSDSKDMSEGKAISDEGNRNALDSEPGNGTEFDPEEGTTKTRQLTAAAAELSADTEFGADGPFLDYAGKSDISGERKDVIVVHDYFGLFVYDLTDRQIVRSLDLSAIGCNFTQGDNACQVAVSADGAKIWLHPRSKQYMFRYEVEENRLWQVPLVKDFKTDLESEDLFERYLVTEEQSEGWNSNYLYEEYKDERGLQTAYIYLYVPTGEELKMGNLQCVWDDMVYILWDENNTFSGKTASAGEFPYRYDGVVHDVEIRYDVPCVYTRISDSFGERVNPVTGEVRVHEGIDYVAEAGADVMAADDGIVYETGYSTEHGNYVVLLHQNGEMTYYCHCKDITVSQEEHVRRGDKIATVGSTGRSTGAHLHFALSRDGEFVNPAEYMQ